MHNSHLGHQRDRVEKEYSKLEAANKAATQRKLHKRKRIQKESTLTVKEGLRLTTLKELAAHSDRKKATKRVRAEGVNSTTLTLKKQSVLLNRLAYYDCYILLLLQLHHYVDYRF